MKAHRAPRRRREDRTTPALVEESPLRGVDPRVKLALSLGLSLAVMLPLAQVAAVLALYTLLLFWARLLPLAARQAWRLRGVLLVLFVVDWLVVSLELAAIVSLRILLLTGTFTLLVATTTSDELQLALVWLRLPYRYAFSVSLAFQSLHLLEEEWRTILEAQRARGAWNPPRNLRGLWQQTRELTALTVPAIVLATRRAWALTEAAYARGFDSPRRRPYRQLRLARLDWALLVGAVVVAGSIFRRLQRLSAHGSLFSEKTPCAGAHRASTKMTCERGHLSTWARILFSETILYEEAGCHRRRGS